MSGREGHDQAARVRRCRCLVEYDGTEYDGWQRQAAGPTVQGEIERALETMTGRATHVVGAGRTDRGVHATGQVAHFDTSSELPIRVLERGINGILSSAIAVRAMEEASPGFHARHSALSRTYRYRVVRGPVRSPLRDRFAWPVTWPLELERMQLAGARLLGEHDFGSFGTAPGRPVGAATPSTVRCIMALVLEPVGDEIIITLTANAFLRHMMRCIVALLVAIGGGRVEPAAVELALSRNDDRLRSRLAPPRGLCLVAVDYGDIGRMALT